MDKRGGGGGEEFQDFLSKIFSLTVTKISVGDGESFSVSLISGIKNVWIRGGGGVSRFSVENFLSHSAEKFHGHPFNVSENLGYRKILCILGGITFFRRKFFVSQCRKILCIIGVSQVSVQNFLSHSAEKLRKGTLQCFTNFGHQKMLRINRKNFWLEPRTYCMRRLIVLTILLSFIFE